MDPELIKRVLNYHGQQMTKIWDIEKGNKSLQKLDVKGLDYHEYQQRAKELAIQDRSKRVKIHHLIVEKAEILLRPPGVDHAGPITPEEQDAIVPLPPLESVLNINNNEKKLQFFKLVKVGDLVIGQVVWRSSTGGSSLAIKILTLDGGKKREVTHMNLKGFIYPSQMPSPEEGGIKDRPFLVNDFIRAEIVELTDSDKIHLGLKGIVASPEVLRHYPLGVMKPEDMPSYIRFGEEKKPKGWTFDDCFEDSAQWENPEALHILAKSLGLLDDDVPKPYTNMIGLSTVSLVEMAPTLRKIQAAKWAFKSVSDGIKYFKEGQEIEAFQCLNKALTIDPANVEGLVARGALFANRGNFDKAIEDFLAALKENILHPNAQKYLAETLCAQGKQYEDENNIDDALTSYQRCLAIVPGHAEAKEAVMEIITFKRKQFGRFELIPLPSDDRFESIRLKLVKDIETAVDVKPMDSDQSDGEDGKRVLREPTPKRKERSLSPFSRKMATIDSTYDNPEGKRAPAVAAPDLEKEYMDFLKDFAGESAPPKQSGSFMKGEWKEVGVEDGVVPPPPTLVSTPPTEAPPPPALVPLSSLGLDVEAPPPPILNAAATLQQEARSAGMINVVSRDKLFEPPSLKAEAVETITPVLPGPPLLTQTPPFLPSSATPPVMPGPPFVSEPPPEELILHVHPEAGPPPHMMFPPRLGHPMGGHHFDPRAPPGFYPPPPFGYHEPRGYHHYPPHHGGFIPPHHAHEPSGSSYDEKVRAFLERIAPTKSRPEGDHTRSEKSRTKYEETTREKRKEHKEKKKQKKRRSITDSSSSSSSTSDSEEESKKKKKKRKSSIGRETPQKSSDPLLQGLGVDLPDIDDLQSKLSAYYKKVDKKEDKPVEKVEKAEKEKKKKKKKKRARSTSSESLSSSSEEEVRKKSKKNISKDVTDEKTGATPSKLLSKDGREAIAKEATKIEGKADRKNSTSIDLFDDGDEDAEFVSGTGKVEKKIPSGKILINLNYKKNEEKQSRDDGTRSVSRSVTLGSTKAVELQSKTPLRDPKKTGNPEDRQSKRTTAADETPRRKAENEESKRRSPERRESRSSRGQESIGGKIESRRSRSRDRSRRERSRSRDRRERSRYGDRSRSRSVEKPAPKAVSPPLITRSQVVYDPKFAMYRRIDIPALPSDKTSEKAPNDSAVPSARRSKSRSRHRSRSHGRRSRSRERPSRDIGRKSPSRDRRSRSRGRDSSRRSKSPPRFSRGSFSGGFRGGFRPSYGQSNRRSRSISPSRRRSTDRDRGRPRPESKPAKPMRYPEELRRPEAHIPKGEPPMHKPPGGHLYATESSFISDNDEYDMIEELIKKNRAAKKEVAKTKNKEFFKPSTS